MTKKVTGQTNANVSSGQNNNNNGQNVGTGYFNRAETLNGNGDGINNKIDNFANFDAFSSTTNDSDLFTNIEFSSTQIDGHNILETCRASSTNAKDRFLGNLRNNTSTKTCTLTNQSDEIDNFKSLKSLNNNFDKQFGSFVTNNTSITDKRVDTKHQQLNHRFSLDSEENFADFSNANVFKSSFESAATINTPCKSKSKTDCDTTTKAEKIPSKFQDDYSKTNDDFDADLQNVLKRSLADQ